MSLLLLLAYFGAGLTRDAMGTLYYRSISERWDWSASVLAGGITVYDIVILATMLLEWNVALVVAYAAGCSVGTMIAIKARRKQ